PGCGVRTRRMRGERRPVRADLDGHALHQAHRALTPRPLAGARGWPAARRLGRPRPPGRTASGPKPKKKGRRILSEPPAHKSGNDLLSHRVPPAVPSALEGLTSEFGMGSGVAPPQ